MNEIADRLQEIAQAVNVAAHAGNLEQVLESIAHVSKDLVHARYSALGVPDGKGGLRYFKTVGLTPEEIRKIGHLPRGKGLLGAIMRDRQTIRISDIASDPRSVGFCEAHPLMTHFLGVPIQVGSQLFGSLYLCDREDGQPFTEQDQALIETMAGYAALAIAGSQLAEQQSRLTLLEERERISMELHDGVIQSLYAIGMHLELSRTSGAVLPNDLNKPISDLNAVIEDVRRYILNLKARDQHQATVYGGLQEVVSRLHVPTQIHVVIDAPDDYPPVPPSVFKDVCQIVNEAVSNVVRHSKSRRLEISARESESLFEVVIADDGTGFDLDKVNRTNGLGLRNIQQRAMMYNGRVTIDTAPGQGTRITITIPI